jgi:serine/threonine-protein kinase HipA
VDPLAGLRPQPHAGGRAARILTTAIDLDDGVCNLDLVLSVAGYFGLGKAAAGTIVRGVGDAVANWRDVAAQRGARPAEIKRMASAFEHDDLTAALAL